MSATLKEIERRTLADGREWTRRELERRLQEEADRIAPVCPRSGLVLKRQPSMSQERTPRTSAQRRFSRHYGHRYARPAWRENPRWPPPSPTY